MSGGDLARPFAGSRRAAAGVQGHKALQQARPGDYCREVSLSLVWEAEGLQLELSGRIDGVYQAANPIIIEEIKTTYRLPDTPDPQHWAQLECYGYMYARREQLESLQLHLVYLELGSGRLKKFTASSPAGELAVRLEALLAPYLRWLQQTAARRARRDLSLESLSFPYPTFRAGQRELAGSIYRGISQGGLLFARAPTGTGKTIAALYPALKALGRDYCQCIFYLTARTTGRIAAEKALDQLRTAGLVLVHVSLTAKEKICFAPEAGCDPALCPYAAGYFDRQAAGLEELQHYTAFNRSLIEKLARKHTLCPFEYSLDLSLAADCLICDYNYVFDPRVQLKRHFAHGKVDYFLLCDEAHNLPDRARSMFSANLAKQEVLALRRSTKTAAPHLSLALEAINKLFIAQRKLIQAAEQPYLLSRELPQELPVLLREFTALAEEWLERHTSQPLSGQVLEMYFAVLHYLKVAELFGPHYVSYFETAYGGNVVARLYCLDPAPQLKEVLKLCRGAVFFSATLLPLDYFKQILAGEPEAADINLPSPFPRDNLKLLVASQIATTYRQRAATYSEIATLLATLYQSRPGPYLIYFPSYAYLNEVAAIFLTRYSGIKTLLQKPRMSEEQRADYLDHFHNPSGPADKPPMDHSTETPAAQIGFAVMGGIFGEGIDLEGEKLIGVIVVGVGLPQLCLERDLIKDYFTDQGRNGFNYAYRNPGFNKVLQAAGRLIRSETDRGVVILIDTRFNRSDYRELFPDEWQHFTLLEDSARLPDLLAEFWAEGG